MIEKIVHNKIYNLYVRLATEDNYYRGHFLRMTLVKIWTLATEDNCYRGHLLQSTLSIEDTCYRGHLLQMTLDKIRTHATKSLAT